MVDDRFRTLELRISFEDFARLPRHPAYKYEYLRGRAVLSPRPLYRHATLDLAAIPPRPAGTPDQATTIRTLRRADWARFPRLFAAAFRTVPPFAALGTKARTAAAELCIEHTRVGINGCVLEPACSVALEPGRGGEPDGAALITLIESGEPDGETRLEPHLTWIMVSPWRSGQGLGTRLFRRAATALRELGYRELTSTFLVGNERSALWHWRNGFRLIPMCDEWSGSDDLTAAPGRAWRSPPQPRPRTRTTI